MHYYQHHIGDYRADTAHLTLLEHGIYRQLLDSYYLNEFPLTPDKNALMRSHSVRNADEMRAFENVLNDFFICTQEGYIHTRCDAEISKFKGKSDKARQSANARWQSKKMRTHSKRNANALQSECEGNANQEPITNINKEKKQAKKETTRTAKAAACIPKPEEVSQQVWNDFLQTRKAKRAPLTKTALDAIEREAVKAGFSLQDALRECAARGWQGFKAEWVASNSADRRTEHQKREDATTAAIYGDRFANFKSLDADFLEGEPCFLKNG